MSSLLDLRMGAVWFLWVFLLSFGGLSEGESVNEVINVGAIFSFNSIDGKVSKIAMKAAEDDVNSDPTLLGGRRLSISMHDSNFSGFQSFIGALNFMETDTVAIIGPQHSSMAHVLSHLANQLHVPLLSFTALDPSLSPLQYPYFIQTAPNNLFLMSAIADAVSYFGWSEVIAIFSDDDDSRNSVAVLRDQLSEKKCRITYKSALPPDPKGTRADVVSELEKIRMMESRVIILITFSRTGLLVLEVAKEIGMMETGFVWFATSWLSSVLDSVSPVGPETARTIAGVVTFRPHTLDSERKAKFVSRWTQLSNSSVGLNSYGLYAYDTVWIIAQAVKSLLDQGTNISFSDDPSLKNFDSGDLNLSGLNVFDGGTQLLSNILQTNMTGVTGPIRFNSYRSVMNPSYDIINVQEKASYRRIGYWSNYSGLSMIPPEILYLKPPNRSRANQHLSNVVWPGGTVTIPRGWVFPNNGRKLRIGVPYRTSYLEFIRPANTSIGVEGYSIDVFLAAIKLLPYAVPFEFILFGDGHSNPNYTQLVKMIGADVFDAAIGDIVITVPRMNVAEFTQPYAESGLVVVTPMKKPNQNAWAFLRPFTGAMWAVTAIFFLFIGAVIWVLEHRINDDFRGPPKKQIGTILWFSLSTMFFAHRENTVSPLGRMVLLIWLFVVMIVNSSYTANLTSILTIQQLSSPITGIDSLISSDCRIGVQVGSFSGNYMIRELSIAPSRLVALGSPKEYANALENGTVAAVVDEQPYIERFLANHCHFSIRGGQFSRSGWGFAFARDSPLAIDMSTAILALSENGELQKIHDRWIRKNTCGSQLPGSDIEQIHIRSFLGLFLICGISFLLAPLIYFFLLLWKFKKRHLHEETLPSSRGGSRSTRFRTFMSFLDEKEDRSQSRRSKRKRKEFDTSMTR